jgi:hypothetical protein
LRCCSNVVGFKLGTNNAAISMIEMHLLYRSSTVCFKIAFWEPVSPYNSWSPLRIPYLDVQPKPLASSKFIYCGGRDSEGVYRRKFINANIRLINTNSSRSRSVDLYSLSFVLRNTCIYILNYILRSPIYNLRVQFHFWANTVSALQNAIKRQVLSSWWSILSIVCCCRVWVWTV